MTALGRRGFPVIRYRTGDMGAREAGGCPAGHPGGWLPRGILGRTDDMVVIRGMNVFPSAIEQLLRESDGRRRVPHHVLQRARARWTRSRSRSSSPTR